MNTLFQNHNPVKAKLLLWLGIFNSILVFSCSNTPLQSQSIIFENIKGDYIRFEDNKLGFFRNPVLGNDSLISMLNNREGKIYIYNYYHNKFTDSFDIKLLSYQYLFDYEIIDTNKILLVFNPTYLDDYHDSAIVMINRDKEILETFSFEGTKAPLYNERDPKGYRNTKWWFVFNLNFPVRYNVKKNDLLACLVPFHNHTCSSLSELSDESVIYRLTSDHPAERMSFPVPPCSEVYYQYQVEGSKLGIRPYGDYDRRGSPIVGFYHNSQLIYQDKIYEPQLKLYELLDSDNLKLEYKRIVYDKYRNCFWWIIQLKNSITTDNPQYKKEMHYYIAQLGIDLNILSEGLLPPNSSQYIVPIKEGLMIKDIRESDSLSIQIFHTLSPKVVHGDEKSLKQILTLLSKGTRKDLAAFASELKKHSPSARRLLLIPHNQMPPKYYQILQSELIKEKKKFPSYAIHIFTNDRSKIKDELKDKVIIHDNFFLKQHYDNFTWPQFLEINPLDSTDIRMEEYPSSEAYRLIEKLKSENSPEKK